MKKYLALVLAVVAALTACENGADAPQEELARIRIGAVSDTQGVTNTRGNTRSVLPTAPALEDVEWFALYGTASGKAQDDPDYKESWLADLAYQNGVFYYRNDEGRKNPAVVYLRPGDWRFTLYAYQGEVAALKGTAIITITASFNGTVNFNLSLYSEEGGTGSVSLRLDLPEGSGVASVETTIDGAPLDPALAVDAGAVVYENGETPAGQYLFSFVLKDSAGKTILVVSDMVVVTSGAESAKEYALAAADFNGPPAAPSNFAVTSYNAGNQTFRFTWQDNSFNETGFMLSDGTTTSTIAAGTQSFDFAATDPTASAIYTLKAVNSFGGSAPVQISGLVVVTVTFDTDNGNAAQTQQIISGGSIGAGMPADPTRAGYTFEGWYTGMNGGGSAFTADTTVNGNITVYAKWAEGVRYELTKNPSYDNYICNTDNLLPSGFIVDADEWVTVSFSIKTDTTMRDFYVGIGDWNNSASYDDGEGGWIASGWRNTKSVTADGQFHAYTWTLTANADAPVGGEPLVFRFAMNSVSKDKVVVYVKDVSVTKSPSAFSNLSLAESLAWITENAEEGGDYTIILKNSETIAPQTLSYNEKNVSITLKGNTAERTVSLSANGSLFTIESGVTLTLGNNVTLQGRSSNTTSLMYVNAGGALTMENGSKVSGNTRASSAAATTYSYGGGVYVSSGMFTMNGGEISGNRASSSAAAATASRGGGVYVSSGVFTMNGGEISGNRATSSTTADASTTTSSYAYGGGVYVSSGVFTMNGGEISGNRAYSTTTADFTTASASSSGGGVYVGSGTFTMNGGEISGNSAAFSSRSGGTSGGGVYVYSSGTFTMNGGEIGGNSAASGGGVHVYGTFTMSGGEISGNSAAYASDYANTYSSAYGGGVFVNGGTFTMSGGEISGNSASVAVASSYAAAYGGGVAVRGGTFTKQSGGTIYGSNASGTLKNTVSSDSYGHAVFVESSPTKKRNRTADSGVTLNSATSGSAGGWE